MNSIGKLFYLFLTISYNSNDVTVINTCASIIIALEHSANQSLLAHAHHIPEGVVNTVLELEEIVRHNSCKTRQSHDRQPLQNKA